MCVMCSVRHTPRHTNGRIVLPPPILLFTRPVPALPAHPPCPQVIQARRSSPVKEEDVLQQFCDARYQNVYGGRQMTEEEIAGLLIAVLFAGQHTSSITSSWTGYFMINDKVRLVGRCGWVGLL